MVWREFNLINSYTLECSFCGPSNGLYKDCHFTINLLKDVGRIFCETLKDYGSETKAYTALQELENLFPKDE